MADSGIGKKLNTIVKTIKPNDGSIEERTEALENAILKKADKLFVEDTPIFEYGSTIGEDDTGTTRARAKPRIGHGTISVKNIIENGYKWAIRVWEDKAYAPEYVYDSGWQVNEANDYDVTGKWYVLAIKKPDDSTVNLDEINRLGITVITTFTSESDGQLSGIKARVKNLEEMTDSIGYDMSATVRTIAHRGDDILAPQCVAQAYVIARKRGLTIAENDVFISADGEYVMWHDVNLGRLGTYLKDVNGYDMYTDGTVYYWHNAKAGKLYTYTNEYNESNVSVDTLSRCRGNDYSVETLPYATLKRIDFGAYKGDKFKGTTILTFEEWVLLCKQLGMELYIDHKVTYTDAIMEDLVSIVKKYGMLDKSSWLNPRFKKLRELDPNARMGVLAHPSVQLIEDYRIYNTGRGFFFNGDGKTMTEEQIRLGVNAGYQVEVWYVDSSSSQEDIFNAYRNAVSFGCTGITTDHYRVDEAFRYLFEV